MLARQTWGPEPDSQNSHEKETVHTETPVLGGGHGRSWDHPPYTTAESVSPRFQRDNVLENKLDDA